MQILDHPLKRYSDGLHLGVQTNPTKDAVQEDVLFKIHAWAPPKAKSYTYSAVTTDYHHVPRRDQNTPTGYASIVVNYFTTLKEGEHPILPNTRGYKAPKGQE